MSAQNIDCRYSLEPPRRGGSNEYPQSMFLSSNKKIIYTPVNPSFTIWKWGLRGSKLYRYVFLMQSKFSKTHSALLKVCWGGNLGVILVRVCEPVFQNYPIRTPGLWKNGPIHILDHLNVDLFIYCPLIFCIHLLWLLGKYHSQFM